MGIKHKIQDSIESSDLHTAMYDFLIQLLQQCDEDAQIAFDQIGDNFNRLSSHKDIQDSPACQKELTEIMVTLQSRDFESQLLHHVIGILKQLSSINLRELNDSELTQTVESVQQLIHLPPIKFLYSHVMNEHNIMTSENEDDIKENLTDDDVELF